VYLSAGSLAETLLSVLELHPFQLCLVDGVRYDVLKGRIQSNPAATLVGTLSRTSLFPTILREICRLNTLTPSKTDPSPLFLPRPDKDGDLVPSTNTQGSSYIGEEGNDFALAYAGGLEFELSLLSLARAVNIRPDKLSGMLWGMQCKGVSVTANDGSSL
jgi:hypothetical protein